MKLKLSVLALFFCSSVYSAEPTMYTSDSEFKSDAATIAQASLVYQTTTELPQSQRNKLESSIKHGCRVFKARYDLTYSPTAFMKRIYPKIEAICDKY